MEINIKFLPTDENAADISDTVCIVLDIFRATSSIVTAFTNGCKAIVPVSSREEAHHYADQLKTALLAGERQSVKIEGFDLGNSPYEFSSAGVKGRTIIMTTTNGTIAIQAAAKAYHTLIGSFINARAVCRQAQEYRKNILIICAGTDRLFSLEDALCAGLLVDELRKYHEYMLTDAAQAALIMYRGGRHSLLELVSGSRNGRRLCDMGCEEDVQYCLQESIVDTVPRYSEGQILCAVETI